MKYILSNSYPSRYCMFKVNNEKIKIRCEICSELTMKTPERGQWRGSGVSIVNFEHNSHLVLVFLLLTFLQVSTDWAEGYIAQLRFHEYFSL